MTESGAIVPPRILLVEDNLLQARLTCQLLGRHGYAANWQRTLADAREAIRAAPPDLLLLDRMLPDGDGTGLCRTLKADVVTRELPIILLTARAQVEDRVEGLACGADDYIPKPFHQEELLARIQGCLRGLALKRELRLKAEELERTNQELVAMQARLLRAERLAAIGEIGLAIRHEVNNPLGTILGFAELLLIEPGTLPPGVQKKLEAISRAALRIRDVLRRLEAVREDRTVEYIPGLSMTDLRPTGPERQQEEQA